MASRDRPPVRASLLLAAGVGLVAAGAFLLAVGGRQQAQAVAASAQLRELVDRSAAIAVPAGEPAALLPPPTYPAVARQISVAAADSVLEPVEARAAPAAAAPVRATGEAGTASLHPLLVAPSTPDISEESPFPEIEVRVGADRYRFTLAGPADLPALGSLPATARLRIPSIGLDTRVTDLDLQNDRGLVSYPPPRLSVGRIATAGNPGERARGWYFGHINERQGFALLPRAVELAAAGETMDVVLETPEGAYLYRVAGRPLILTVQEFDGGYFHHNLYAAVPEIVLTTCLPPGNKNRLLVTARLVGSGPLPAGRDDVR